MKINKYVLMSIYVNENTKHIDIFSTSIILSALTYTCNFIIIKYKYDYNSILFILIIQKLEGV